ncbi:MAG: 16S rRNA (guanine(966)-N(2))-methyltransferase RsmD [Acidobacteria bacterium]|nr:16S rRNA (guanine(966)-N(2))-methyltransferase RsmD [Acidobacteriota bacterium]
MRVIGGALKGRRLDTPKWPGLRPTSDRLRETLFDVLGDRVDSVQFIDGFAGTGAVGIEALSRGAAHVTFVETDPRAVRLIKTNLRHCALKARYTIVHVPMQRAWRKMAVVPSDIIFLDPPYGYADLETVLVGAAGQLTEDGFVVLEHAARRKIDESVDGLMRRRVVCAGDSALSFYDLKV